MLALSTCGTSTLRKSYRPTWEDIIQVPGEGGVYDGVKCHHEDGGEEREGVLLQRAGPNVVPLQTQTLLFVARQVLRPEAKGHLRQQALTKQGDATCTVGSTETNFGLATRSLFCFVLSLGFFFVVFLPRTYCSQLHVRGDAVLPGEAEDVRQVKGEVDYAAAGGSQVGLVEEDAHEEALHDGGDGEGQQEEEDEDGVTVIQHLPSL